MLYTSCSDRINQSKNYSETCKKVVLSSSSVQELVGSRLSKIDHYVDTFYLNFKSAYIDTSNLSYVLYNPFNIREVERINASSFKCVRDNINDSIIGYDVRVSPQKHTCLFKDTIEVFSIRLGEEFYKW